MRIRAYLTLTTQVQTFDVLAAVHTITPWSVPRAGSGRTRAEGVRPITQPVVDGHRTRDVPESRRPPELSDMAPLDSLQCGILVGDELRAHGMRGPCDGTGRAFLRV